jgi:hypothetical protein
MLANGNVFRRNKTVITKRPTNELQNKPSTGIFPLIKCPWSEPANIKASDPTYNVSNVKNVTPAKRLRKHVTDARMMPNDRDRSTAGFLMWTANADGQAQKAGAPGKC